MAASRKEIFAQAARKLRQDFRELSTVPHNALKGGEAEELVRRFLRSRLPQRFGVGAGFIIDQADGVSKQTDVVIYDAHNCPVYRASDTASIFPSNNVAAVVEVKSQLTTDELRRGFENIVAAKSLKKHGPPDDIGPLRTQTYGCIFAFDSKISLPKILDGYSGLTNEHGIGLHPDLILVLDRAVFSLACKAPFMPDWNTVSFNRF